MDSEPLSVRIWTIKVRGIPLLELVRRITMLVIGSVLLAASIWLIFNGPRIPGFAFTYEIEHGDFFDFDFTFWLYITAMLASMGMIVTSVKLSRVPPDELISFPASRFVAGLLLCLLGLASFVLFGASFGGFDYNGLWLFLGGLSLFYPTGMFPLLIGIMILLFSAFSFAKIRFSVHFPGEEPKFSKEDGAYSIERTRFTRQDAILSIDEMRFPRGMSTRIPVKDIQVARLSSSKTGIKFLWILPFIIPAYFLYVDGFSFLLNPNRSGSGELVGWAYLVSATVQVFAMLLLILRTQHVLEIITKDRIYELHIEPANLYTLVAGDLSRMLQLPVERGQVAGTKLEPLVQPTDWKRVIIGCSFIFIAIAGRVWHFWAGEILRLILLIGGLVFLVEGIKNDLKFVHGKMHVTVLDQGTGFFISGKGVMFRTQYLFQGIPSLAVTGADGLTTHTTIQPRKLTTWDHVACTAIMLATGMQFQTILAAPAAVGEPAAGMTAIVLALVLLVFIAPGKVFKVKLGDMNYQVPVIAREPGQNWLWVFVTFFKKYAIVIKTHKWQILLRISEIFLALALGMVFGLILRAA